MTKHRTGTRKEWLAARLELLEAEKELTRHSDEVARQRQALPWERVDKEYPFETDKGIASLKDLFRGRSQLIVYHFMFGPDFKAGCLSCSAIADGFNGFYVHLANHDVMLWAVSRAPLAKLQAYKRRMGWTFPWASSHGGDFNFDFNASFTEEQQRTGAIDYNFRRDDPVMSVAKAAAPIGPHADIAAMTGTDVATYLREREGMSTFALEDGVVYHAYSTYARGVDGIWAAYAWLDRAPKGRNETGFWWRRHDEYDKRSKFESDGGAINGPEFLADGGGTMKNTMRNELAAPAVVDRSIFQAQLDALRVREKAHTREGDAIAAARRRLPMVEVDGMTPLIGERGAVTLFDAFEGRRLLIAYYFMWYTGQTAPEQCEGCTWVTSQVRELSYIHPRDVTYATFCQGPYEESVRYRDFMGWEMPWYSAKDSLDTLLVGRRVGMMHIVCYLRQGSNVFETYWTTTRGAEAMDNSYRLLDLTVYGRQETWEDSPAGWPQRFKGKQVTRTDGRPTAQWSRLKAGHSDDLGTGSR